MSLEQTHPKGQFVCPKCGWSVISIDVKYNHHESRCNAAGGELAVKLAGMFPEIPSTKFGHGEHRLTFNLVNDHKLVFDCGRTTLTLNHLFGAHNLDLEATRDLVATLNEWSKRHPTE